MKKRKVLHFSIYSFNRSALISFSTLLSKCSKGLQPNMGDFQNTMKRYSRGTASFDLLHNTNSRWEVL